MSIKYIIIVLGEPYSTFSEIIGKYFKKVKKFKKKIILIGNRSLIIKQLQKLNLSTSLNEIHDYKEAKKNVINIINIYFKYKKTFSDISIKSNRYIEKSFEKSLEIIKKEKKKCVLINGPISKKTFLRKRYPGITEYLADKTNSNSEIMLIYNKKISVSPLTTHIPIKYINKKINKSRMIKNISNLNKFYKEFLNQKFRCAVLGLNPHCETLDKFSEEDKIIKPSIYYLKKRGINVSGPFSADTFFLGENLNNYNFV